MNVPEERIIPLLCRIVGDKVIIIEGEHVHHRFERSTRGEIVEYSMASARRLRDYLLGCDAVYTGFGTLTYPVGAPQCDDPMAAKKDLRALFERLRRMWGGTDAFHSVCWFMEWTKQGTVHFHFLANDFIDKAWLSKAWYEIVGSEDKRHLFAGTQISALHSRGAAAKYAAKYASKGAFGQVPEKWKEVGRWWGVFGIRTVVEADIRIRGKRNGMRKEVRDEVLRAVVETMRLLTERQLACEVELPREYGDVRMFRVPDIQDRRMLREIFLRLRFHVNIEYTDEAAHFERLERF